MVTPKWKWMEATTYAGDASLRFRQFHCKVGEYPWDDWYLEARAGGLETEIALLGSNVMRVADQHSWPAELQTECGWDDAGAGMLAMAARDPERARRRWQALLENDGEPGRAR